MEMPTNSSPPFIMHIDLNSCFATIEQQANPLIRNKPVVVAAYNKPYGAILSPSIEAKRIGIKMGMRVSDAQLIYPHVIVRAPDPSKYREAHQRFMKIFRSYSPDVTPKSIDEAVIDFSCFVTQNKSSPLLSSPAPVNSPTGEAISSFRFPWKENKKSILHSRDGKHVSAGEGLLGR